jgi:hypothetical protein
MNALTSGNLFNCHPLHVRTFAVRTVVANRTNSHLAQGALE